jgi:hypothetical protein
MKKTLIFSLLLVSTFMFAQSQTATTEDGKKVELKNDGTWHYLEAVTNVKKSEIDCNCNDIDEKKARKSGFLTITESSAKDLKKHVSVDIGCDIDKIKVINSSEQKGSAVYILCVCDKKMKYRRVGSVFYKDGDNPLKLN